MGGGGTPGAVAVVIAGGVAARGGEGAGGFAPAWGVAGAAGVDAGVPGLAGVGTGVPAAGAGVPGLAGAAGLGRTFSVLPGGRAFGFLGGGTPGLLVFPRQQPPG